MAESETQRGQLLDVAALSEAEQAKRIQLFAVMLGAFPVARNQDLSVTLDGYVTLTADIPIGWLTQAIKRLMMHPDTVFAPTVGKIREQSAIEIIRTKRMADGKDPDRSDTGITKCPAEQIDHWIGQARKLLKLPEIGPASSAVYIPAELSEAMTRIERNATANRAASE